jgi:hypothetical protein
LLSRGAFCYNFVLDTAERSIFMKNVVIGQSGGPTSVINSSLAGVYAGAKAMGAGRVYGMIHGIEGFLQDRLVDLDRYLSDPMGIELLKRTPSAFLGTCRFKMGRIEGNEERYEKVFEIMEKHDIELLNAYHRTVYEKLSPYFNGKELQWLKEVTREV